MALIYTTLIFIFTRMPLYQLRARHQLGDLPHAFHVRLVRRVKRVTGKRTHTDRLSSSGKASDTVQWNIAQINADKCWARGVDGSGVVVATIDGGVNYQVERNNSPKTTVAIFKKNSQYDLLLFSIICVQSQHTALVGNYRGTLNSGTGAFNHTFNWNDFAYQVSHGHVLQTPVSCTLLIIQSCD